jgi:hypothetical protein
MITPGTILIAGDAASALCSGRGACVSRCLGVGRATCLLTNLKETLRSRAERSFTWPVRSKRRPSALIEQR